MEAKIGDMAESGTSVAGEPGTRPDGGKDWSGRPDAPHGGGRGWSGKPNAPHGGGRGWSGRPDAPHGGRGWSGRPNAPHGGGRGWTGRPDAPHGSRGWSGRPDAPHGGGREIFGRVSPGVHDCALGAWEWSNKQRVDSSGGSSEYRFEDRKWTTTAILGRDLVWRPSDEGRVMDSGAKGSVVEMEEFPAVYVRTLFTGKQMKEEEDDLCTYGLFDEVVGEATDSSTNAAVVSGLLSDENVYRGEKGFTESGASCDTLSSKLKRLAARYEQHDDIVDRKDVVGTIEPRLHANVGKDVLDEKQRPSEITDPGELSSSDSGCDSGNSCDRSFNDDCHNCVEDTCKADARRLDDGCGARELCISEEDDQRLDGGCCARSTCMGEGDVNVRGSCGLDSSKMDELRGCEAGLDSESESEYEDDDQYLRLEETILQQEEVIEVLGRDLKKFEDGKKQFKERVEVWEKQANREKDALVELRERYEEEWFKWEEEKSQMEITKSQHEHQSKVLRELEREVKEKQLQLEYRENDMEERALTLKEGEQKLKQREIQFDEWFQQWENNRRMQEEEFEIRRAEDLKERKLWETDLRKRELVLSAKVEKYKEEKKACESCLGVRQEALLEAEAKFDERRERSARLEDNLQCEWRQGICVVSSEEGSGVEDRGRGRGRTRQKKTRVKQRRHGGRSRTEKSRSEASRESIVDGCSRRREQMEGRPKMIIGSEEESSVEDRERSRVRQKLGAKRCSERGCTGCVEGKEGQSLNRCTRQRKRTNSESLARSAVPSPSLLAESSSNKLDGGMAQVEIRGRQAYEEMDCGDNVHSTGRNEVREGECGMCDDSSPMQRVKRVQNAEEYDPTLHSKPKREKQVLTYDGNTPWKDFYVHFEACKVYNRWTDQEATYQLFTCCRGNALTMLGVNDVDPKEMKYSELVKLMGKEFGPRECSELYFHDLNKREQKPGESLRSLGQDIRRLTALAFPRIERKERDRIALEHFKQAVADPELRKELFRTHPDTLEDAVDGALAVESFYRLERIKERSRLAFTRVVEAREVPTESVADVKKRMDVQVEDRVRDMERRVDILEKEMEAMRTSEVEGKRGCSTTVREGFREARGSRGSVGKSQGRSGVCYSCQKPGHVARYCTQVVCFRCREPGHQVRDCSHKSVVCKRCRSEGHIARFCTRSGNDGRGKTKVVHTDRLKLGSGPDPVTYKYQAPAVVEEDKPGVRVVDEEEPEGMRKGRGVSSSEETLNKVVAGNDGQRAGEKTVQTGDKAEIGGREVVRNRPMSRYVSLYNMFGGRNGVNLSSSIDGGKGEGGGCRQWRSSREDSRKLPRYR